MGETLTIGQVFWIISEICIVVVLAGLAIAVLIWWLMRAFDDKQRIKDYRDIMVDNASAADAWLNKYYKEKRDHANTVDFYTGALERKDRKIDSMGKMDAQRINRIKQLEEQLRENGIEPVEWDFVA